MVQANDQGQRVGFTHAQWLGQAHNHLAQERPGHKTVYHAVTRVHQRHPEQVLAVATQVIGKPRQVVKKDVRLARFLAGQPVAPDAVAHGLVHQHVVLARSKRHTVGKAQLLHVDGCFAGVRVPGEQAAAGP